MTQKTQEFLFNNECEWVGMPEFIQEKKSPYKKCSIFIKSDSSIIFIRFNTQHDFKNSNPLSNYYDGKNFYVNDRALLSEMLGQKLTAKTKSIWHPFKAHKRVGKQPQWESSSKTKNKYPIYVISKGRHKNCLTAKELNRIKVDFILVVEPQEYDLYRIEFPENRIKTTPFSDLGQGSVPVRNFVWDCSIRNGNKKHWILDDNIVNFHRLNENQKYKVSDGQIFSICENFTDRYKNVKISGMNYYSFCKASDAVPPVYFNTRVYSCTLIDNSLKHRWRGKYNEDTDLCLRSLKDGDCTVLFNALLCGKVTSMRMKGGNTNEVYGNTNNRLEFAESLKNQHPDVVDVVWKFNRWHHQVNYKPFKKNKLIKISETGNMEKINNYGMVLY